ncbi:MAG: hypothetical protein WA664_14690 [Candidatus Acidiferrales bacterium]
MKAVSLGFQFDNVDGWSMREYALGHVTYPLNLSGRSVTLVSSGRQSPDIYDLTVDVLRPDHAAQRIWSFNERPHLVTKQEYQRIFTSGDRNDFESDH